MKTYTFVTLKGEDDNFIGVVPEISGIVAQALTQEELFPRIKTAIMAYNKTLEEEKLVSPQSLKLIGVNEVNIE